MLDPVLTRIEPYFSPRLWGQYSLAPLFPEKSDLAEPIGEAWLTAFDSRVANGPFAGKTLREAWHTMPPEWRGSRHAHLAEFPVLIKFLFPNDMLSIQVHPDDEFAAKYEQDKGGRGKTEMWHIVSAERGAEILFGVKPGVSREDFLRGITHKSVDKLLVPVPVHPGETYFVAAGTQHALGPGMIVCEVQEYSDLTYRVYDFGRVDPSGKPRELHIEKAMEVTNFAGGHEAGKVPSLALHSPDANKHLLAACKYFATERWDCHKTAFIESESDEFQLFITLSGDGAFYDSEVAFPFHPGQAWFLPANLPTILLQPNGCCSVLRVTVPDPLSLRAQLHNQGFDDAAISRVLIEGP